MVDLIAVDRTILSRRLLTRMGREDLIIVGSFEEAEGMIEERIVLELEDVPAYLWLPDRITLESRKK